MRWAGRWGLRRLAGVDIRGRLVEESYTDVQVYVHSFGEMILGVTGGGSGGDDGRCWLIGLMGWVSGEHSGVVAAAVVHCRIHYRFTGCFLFFCC